MDLTALLAAIECGDDIPVLEFLDFEDTPRAELGDDDGLVLLAAAAYAGRHEVVGRLIEWGVDPTRPWADGTDPVTWAAESGAFWVLEALLRPEGDPLRADSSHRRALRAAQSALKAGTGAGSLPPPAHRAVITAMEAKLGVQRKPDELMARALVHADPDHDDWRISLFRIADGDSRAAFDWARTVAEEADRTGDLHRRRFALDTVSVLDLGLHLGNEDDPPPLPREAAQFLRPRLDTEQDPHALRCVLAAFIDCCSREELPAVLTHAGHPASVVRSCVVHAFPELLEHHPDTLAVLLRLAEDPIPSTRTNALYSLTFPPHGTRPDTPHLRTVLAAHLTDPHLEVRLEAAAALALRVTDAAQRYSTRSAKASKTSAAAARAVSWASTTSSAPSPAAPPGSRPTTHTGCRRVHRRPEASDHHPAHPRPRRRPAPGLPRRRRR
ncbi:hypothetical protein ACIA8O_37125 [Kitasatospora sp. NPDC051853]|uniref:hypothetical protein n=1 Tax=Kitasatospora sp. NPDC051853 TaxID=3364058 RepID=UPI0037BD40DF